MLIIAQCFITTAQQPPVGQGLLIHEVSRSHTKTHHNRYDSSGRVISSSQRPLPDKTQHLQQTNVHAPGGIRNHDRSRREAVDLRLRPRGYWDRHNTNGLHNITGQFINRENVYNLQLITFDTAHSKPIILCVLPSLVRPTALLFSRTSSATDRL